MKRGEILCCRVFGTRPLFFPFGAWRWPGATPLGRWDERITSGGSGFPEIQAAPVNRGSLGTEPVTFGPYPAARPVARWGIAQPVSTERRTRDAGLPCRRATSRAEP